MRLRELLEEAPADLDLEVGGLAYDHRRLTPRGLFFCVPGLVHDGHDYAERAVGAGAVALVVDHALPIDAPQVVVADVREAMARAAARFADEPSRAMDVVGVTGTNGKTTVSFLVRELLDAVGRPCGMLGTVSSVVGGVATPTERTTPEAIDLQPVLAAMVAAGDVACAMEVSSHALELRRADGIAWAAAVFTNLTQDHLDFHPDMESYFQAKRRLFVGTPEPPRAAIVNLDDPYGRRLAQELGDRATTFSLDGPADYAATEVETGLGGTRIALATPDGPLELASPLPGRFNASNVVAAVAAVRALGVPGEAIAAALPDVGRVPGRFEPVDAGQPFLVLVDYAHTPDSLDNVLRAARDLVQGEGRVRCAFGAGGDRDRGKRPLMGAAAARWADHVVITSDNPRSEDPGAIIDAIVGGIDQADASARGVEVEVEPDRRRAIERLVAAAGAGDVVVIAGKGHEQGQTHADGRTEPFDDVAVAREALGRVVGR